MTSRQERGRLRTGLFALASLPLASGVASAHEVGGSRFDAPLPLSLLFVGAGGTVALTAVWLALTGRPERTVGTYTVATFDERILRRAKFAGRVVFLTGVVAAVATGMVGRQVAAENFATVFTWAAWFRGLGLIAILVGSPWAALSPWRAIYLGLCRLEGGELALVEYPSWAGTWPAVGGFVLLIGILENLSLVPQSPVLTAVVIAGYTLIMLGGAVIFGPTWFDRADPLGLLYRVLGRVAGVSTQRTSGTVTILLRPPWRGCTVPVTDTAVAVFVVAAVYTVSFDGFTNTRQFQTLLFGTRDLLGTGIGTGLLLYGLGLGAFVVTFIGAVVVGDTLGSREGSEAGMTTDGGHLPIGDTVTALAPTVLPIAAAYDVAHNYPYIVRSTARLVELSAGSVGMTTGSLDPLGWLALPVFWGSQVLLIVVGHVVAVVAAHTVTIDRYASVHAARRAHLPLVVLMIGYTVLSLWIISQPVVR